MSSLNDDDDDQSCPRQASKPTPSSSSSSPRVKKTRTRSGCLNCRRKKRKCDESRPQCGTCTRRHERCEWGLKITFRAENAFLFDEDHPALKELNRKTYRNVEIINVTNEVIRDYDLPSPTSAAAATPHDCYDDASQDCEAQSTRCGGGGNGNGNGNDETPTPFHRPHRLPPPPSSSLGTTTPVSYAQRPPPPHPHHPPSYPNHLSPPEDVSTPSSSLRHSENAVANLILLSQGGPASHPSDHHHHHHHHHHHPQSLEAPSSFSADLIADYLNQYNQSFSTPPEGGAAPPTAVEDGVFLPGSAYHELHSTLRNHLIQEVRSEVCPSQPQSPYSSRDDNDDDDDNDYDNDDLLTATTTTTTTNTTIPLDPDNANRATTKLSSSHPTTSYPAPLTPEDEMHLWRNWFGEIAPWLDKFDSARHFQHIIPTMTCSSLPSSQSSSLPSANSNSHLRSSILALSARQVELKSKQTSSLPSPHLQPRSHPSSQPAAGDHSLSLSLYQQSIHLLLPQLPTRSTAVIASCVILCVLEMLSCSPKAWRRHLDGCASLMEAVGINGFVGGTEEALFWCFARMDVCGGLISSVKTLIPVGRWVIGGDIDADVRRFKEKTRLTGDFGSWSHFSVYLLAQVLDLLAPDPHADQNQRQSQQEEGTTAAFKGLSADDDPARFRARWLKLWGYIADWYECRPKPLHAIMSVPSSSPNSSPFPTVIFSNPAAISGNQLHHTASVLMLQNQPPNLSFHAKGRTKRPKSILWHARQICAISISNDHHGAWTNSVQPLWIAGRCMSHPAEHEAILRVLDRIEDESGWGARWRAEDLREFWGDLGE